MNRQEFMTSLESLLVDIPALEREEALKFYNDYFDDAGPDNESSIIRSLGTPEKVAKTIKEDMGKNSFADGYEEEKVEKGKEMVEYQYEQPHPEYRENPVKEEKKSSKAVWVSLLCICAFPFVILFDLLVIILEIVLLAVVVSLIAAVLAIVAAISAVFASVFIVALVCFVLGIMCLPFSITVGAILIGVGLLCAAVGCLFLMFDVVLCGYVIPACFKGIAWLFKKCFKRKKKH